MSELTLQYKDSHIVDLPKITEIRDCLNNLWYKVILKVDPLSETEEYTYYRVKVINYKSAEEPLIVVDRPTEDEPKIYSYDEALKLFNEYLKNYSAVVKATTRDILNIDIYAEKIGYKDTKPSCCATCQFCHVNKGYISRESGKFLQELEVGITGRLECWNSENQYEYEFNVGDKLNLHYLDNGMNHFDGLLWPKHKDIKFDIHPRVLPFGICPHYLLRTDPIEPIPGLLVNEYIDNKLGCKLDNKISSIIEEIINT